ISDRVNVLPNSFFFSSRRRHTISVSAFLLNRSSDLGATSNSTKHKSPHLSGWRQIRSEERFRSNTASNSTKHKSPHLSGWRQIRSEERRVGKECRTRKKQ